MIKTIIKRIGRTSQLNKPFSEKIKLAMASSRLHVDSLLNTKSKKFRQVSFLGLKASAYTYQTIDYLFEEIFIGNEYFFESNRPDPVIIDCGANIGFATLYFKKSYPASKIICFEANPYAFEVLKEN